MHIYNLPFFVSDTLYNTVEDEAHLLHGNIYTKYIYMVNKLDYSTMFKKIPACDWSTTLDIRPNTTKVFMIWK